MHLDAFLSFLIAQLALRRSPGVGTRVEAAAEAKSASEGECPHCSALEEMFLANGARIGYWRGSIEGVAEDLQAN